MCCVNYPFVCFFRYIVRWPLLQKINSRKNKRIAFEWIKVLNVIYYLIAISSVFVTNSLRQKNDTIDWSPYNKDEEDIKLLTTREFYYPSGMFSPIRLPYIFFCSLQNGSGKNCCRSGEVQFWNVTDFEVWFEVLNFKMQLYKHYSTLASER
jgi:hypothetical protein